MLKGANTQSELEASSDEDSELDRKTALLEKQLRELEKQQKVLKHELQDSVTKMLPTVSPRYEEMRRRREAKKNKKTKTTHSETNTLPTTVSKPTK